MAEIQEGVRAFFDDIEASDATSEDTTSTQSSEKPKNWHQEMYPSYVPPHRRGHNTQQDKFVNFKDTKNGQKDKVQGVDNDKFQRYHLAIPFACPRDKMKKLISDFPGVYFSCRDNGTHDHPYSHVVTMWGTRVMQRMIGKGKKILDVYGNPNACDRFNTSQMNAGEPKFMKALVQRVGPADFVRETNKWGPFFDEENGERYHRGPLMSMVTSGEIGEYDTLHMVHTLYYIPFSELAVALHAPGKKRKAYALIHKHEFDKGSLNDGEQTYEKKWIGNTRLVKQTNVRTKSQYVHPDLTDTLFATDKSWLPDAKLASRVNGESQANLGLAWEVHMVNDETWVVEFVPYVKTELVGVRDYAAEWEVFDDDPLTTPSESTSSIQVAANRMVIPTEDGKFIDIDIPCVELFNKLRMRCSGRKREPKLLEELISTANHLVDPSGLFGDSIGMRCPPDKVYDVAVAAFAADIEREKLLSGGLACIRPVLVEHARNMKMGPQYKDFCIRDVMSAIRTTLQGVRDINRVVRAKDPLDQGLDHLQGYLN